MEDNQKKSPKILSCGWGKIAVEHFGRGRDCKLWPGGYCQWDWRLTDTSHAGGVQIADLEELIDKGCSVIVIGRGIFSRLKMPEATIRYLEKSNISFFAADTRKAVRIYNGHVDKGIPTGGLFHTTC